MDYFKNTKPGVGFVAVDNDALAIKLGEVFGVPVIPLKDWLKNKQPSLEELIKGNYLVYYSGSFSCWFARNFLATPYDFWLSISYAISWNSVEFRIEKWSKEFCTLDELKAGFVESNLVTKSQVI